MAQFHVAWHLILNTLSRIAIKSQSGKCRSNVARGRTQKGHNEISFKKPYRLRPVMTSRLARSVFVGRLNFRTIEQDLRFHFEQCGTVDTCDIVRGSSGQSKGFGFVGFSRPQDAGFAVQTLEGSLLDGKQIHVEFNKPILRRRMAGRTLEREFRNEENANPAVPADAPPDGLTVVDGLPRVDSVSDSDSDSESYSGDDDQGRSARSSRHSHHRSSSHRHSHHRHRHRHRHHR
jgi:RNA recognition motif-containing protein